MVAKGIVAGCLLAAIATPATAEAIFDKVNELLADQPVATESRPSSAEDTPLRTEQGPFVKLRPGAFHVGSLVGMEVLGTKGQPIGVVRDLMVSSSGTIMAMVVATNAFSGQKRKVVALAWNTVARPAGRVVHVNIAPKEVATAPSYATSAAEPAPEGIWQRLLQNTREWLGTLICGATP